MPSRQFESPWDARVKALVTKEKTVSARAYVAANLEMICRTMEGRGPEDPRQLAAGRAKAVVCMSSAHMPAFCNDKGDRAYKNGYAVGSLQRPLAGVAPKDIPRRVRLDAVIGKLAHCKPEDIHYAAMELNGTGVRFYGDMCMVLKSIPADTLLLDRNSYDVLRAPICGTFNPRIAASLATQLKKIAGVWVTDAANMAATKILGSSIVAPRRMTTGQVSDGLLCDEDYVEVILTQSFSVDAVLEVRLHPNDVAKAEHIRGLEFRKAPRCAQLEWGRRRRAAEDALLAARIPMRVVSDSGRSKS